MKIKKVNNKYKIFLNDEVITTYDEVIINNNILYKKNLSEDLIKKIKSDTFFYDVYNKTLKYINTKLRSENEVSIFLDKLKVSSNDKKKIILKLKKVKLIDDKMFTKAYIHDRLLFSSDGPIKIKKDLLNHKIDEIIVNEEFLEIDSSIYLEKLKKQILARINKNTKYSNNMLKQRLLNYFINLGYDKSDILLILDKYNINDSSIIKGEYDKLYKKYKDKYDSEYLNYFIKNKLYMKGFSCDEINEILE